MIVRWLRACARTCGCVCMRVSASERAVCVCACVRACVQACVRVCMRVCMHACVLVHQWLLCAVRACGDVLLGAGLDSRRARRRVHAAAARRCNDRSHARGRRGAQSPAPIHPSIRPVALNVGPTFVPASDRSHVSPAAAMPISLLPCSCGRAAQAPIPAVALTVYSALPPRCSFTLHRRAAVVAV